MSLFENMKDKIASKITDAFDEAVAGGELNATEAEISDMIKLEVPKDKLHGDFACNIAMMLAKELRMTPRKIADAIVAHIQTDEDICKVEVAGAGFINFYLTPNWLYKTIQQIEEQGKDYGKIDLGKGKKVMVEFVSANPTGPMHMGNARGGALGDCLAAVLEKAGYYVEREFYVNDAGNQILKFALSLSIRYLSLYLPEGDPRCELPEDSYHGADILERAKEFAAVYGDAYVHVSEDERQKALVDFALPKNIAAMKELMHKYRIEYDTWFLESELHKKEVGEVIDILTEKGYTYEKDGALWFAAAKVGGEEYKDEVLVRSNGTPTYFTADIAYHRNKLSKRNFARAIDIWGADHHGHVARLKNALNAVGENGDKLDVVLMQLVRLIKDGKPAKMSKRTGKSVTLNELIEEVGTDAARFFFIMRSMDSQLDFDLTLATEHSNDNPVYYVQYAHARICSILRQMEEEKIALRKDCDLSVLKEPIEVDLIKKLNDYEELIETAAAERAPHKIAHYVYDLAGLFHSFYNQCRVLGVDPAVQQARLALITAVGNTLRHGLKILGVSAPDHM